MHASASAADSGGFFTYHGLWAPGVRLFRRLSFGAKAALISATFLVPLAVLGAFFLSNLRTQIEFSEKERLGVVYARAMGPLLDAAQQARAGGPADALEAAHTAVAAVQQKIGAELGTAAAHADWIKALETFRAKPDGGNGDALLKAAVALLV